MSLFKAIAKQVFILFVSDVLFVETPVEKEILTIIGPMVSVFIAISNAGTRVCRTAFAISVEKQWAKAFTGRERP